MIPRVLSFTNHLGIIRELKNIKVDEYGIKIMSPKADFFIIKIHDVSSIAANILKQEMLSLGGDAAISRDSITGKDKKTSCLIMGSFIQLSMFINKLKLQPFKLDEIGSSLEKTLRNYKKDKFLIRCRNYTLDTGKKTLLMGIINLTSDSFSGDGLLRCSCTDRNLEEVVLEKTEQMIKDGVDIIDVGAESSRPGAKPISEKEEVKKISLCVKKIAKKYKIPISVDTHKPGVAEAGLDSGASIINDITGLKQSKMRKIIAKYKAAAVIMHMKGIPRTMQVNPQYKSLIDEVISFLSDAVDLAVRDGISQESIIVDPGIGFGKTLEHNLAILKNIKEFKVLGKPILLGVSRKSFIGKILNVGPEERIFGTSAAVAMAIKDGVNILRVHDVKEMHQVSKICDSIINN